MSKTIGRFSYDVQQMGKNHQIPFDPVIQLILKHWGRVQNDGAPCISPDLATEEEISRYIEDLKDDLDAVGKKAKSALREARARTKAIVTTRRSAKDQPLPDGE